VLQHLAERARERLVVSLPARDGRRVDVEVFISPAVIGVATREGNSLSKSELLAILQALRDAEKIAPRERPQ
jgi:hypothetical protein